VEREELIIVRTFPGRQAPALQGIQTVFESQVAQRIDAIAIKAGKYRFKNKTKRVTAPRLPRLLAS
jgi:hypothetical protein